jgi:uncharacterized protein (TIGR03067 family)
MNCRIPVLLSAALALVGFSYLGSIGEGKDKAGKKAIQGTWTAAKGDQKMELSFHVDKTFSLSFKGKKLTGTYTVDPSKSPAHLDMTVTDAGSDDETKKYMGKTSKAIYQIDGNKMKWLAPEPGNEERPTAFPKEGEKTKALYITW